MLCHQPEYETSRVASLLRGERLYDLSCSGGARGMCLEASRAMDGWRQAIAKRKLRAQPERRRAMLGDWIESGERSIRSSTWMLS